MDRLHRLLIVALVLVLAACGDSTPVPTSAPSVPAPSAISTAAGTSIITPALTSVSTIAATRLVVTPSAVTTPRGAAALPYSDDFSTVSSGWPVGTFNKDVVEYRNGAYRILIGQENFLRTAWLSDFNIADMSVEVDASIANGPDDGMIGVVCRVDTTKNSYYGFLIGADKRYSLVKVIDGKTSTLSEYFLQPNSIRASHTSNHIRSDCAGDMLALFVNDQKLIENHDSGLKAGSFGLIASTGPSGKSGVDTTFTKIAVHSAPVTLTPSPTPAMASAPAFNNVVLRDDFTNAASGWPLRDDGDVKTEYKINTYHVMMQKDNTSVLLHPKQTFNLTDVSVEVTAASAAGPIENSFGVACRVKDEMNYYRLVIGADGFFGIAKVKAGENTWLAFHESLSSLINVRKSPADVGKSNTLRADCIGDKLSLFVNGRKLDEVRDSEFTTGDVGLRIGTEKAAAEVSFKDFVVHAP